MSPRARLARATVGGTARAVDLARLPQVTIVTDAAAPVASKDDYVNGTVTITRGGPGGTTFSAPTQIKGRGNTTWLLPKKPYRFKLVTAASLFGQASDRDWILLANYLDPAMIRGAIAFEMGRRLTGLPWTPQFVFCEVTLNGQYLGVHQFGPHVKVSTARVNVTKASGTTGLALTGAYTLEIDQRLEQDAAVGFRTSRNIPVTFDDPDGTNATQFSHVQTHMQAFEDALYATTWRDPATGYARYIDRNSWIDWLLVNELTANQDSGFFSSVKLYKQRDPDVSTLGRLFMGPLWDFDRSIKWDGRSPTGWWTKNRASWYDRLCRDPDFRAALRTRWQAMKTAITTGDTINAFAGRAIRQIGQPAHRDRIAWSYSLDWAAALTEITGWLDARIAWLDAATAPRGGGELAFNPDNEYDTNGWNTNAGTGGAATGVVGAPGARSGTAGYRVTWTTAATAAGGLWVDAGIAPAAGTSYTISVWVRPSRAMNMRAVAQWGPSPSIGSSIACPANTWTQLPVAATAPAGAYQLNVTAYATDAPSWQVGDTLDGDDLSVKVA